MLSLNIIRVDYRSLIGELTTDTYREVIIAPPTSLVRTFIFAKPKTFFPMNYKRIDKILVRYNR